MPVSSIQLTMKNKEKPMADSSCQFLVGRNGAIVEWSGLSPSFGVESRCGDQHIGLAPCKTKSGSKN
jgi:hypothetical protein